MNSGALVNIGTTILSAIQAMGWPIFIVIVVIDIILYRIHPVLGILGTLIIFALLFGII